MAKIIPGSPYAKIKIGDKVVPVKLGDGNISFTEPDRNEGPRNQMKCPHCTNGTVDLIFKSFPCDKCNGTGTLGPSVPTMKIQDTTCTRWLHDVPMEEALYDFMHVDFSRNLIYFKDRMHKPREFVFDDPKMLIEYGVSCSYYCREMDHFAKAIDDNLGIGPPETTGGGIKVESEFRRTIDPVGQTLWNIRDLPVNAKPTNFDYLREHKIQREYKRFTLLFNYKHQVARWEMELHYAV